MEVFRTHFWDFSRTLFWNSSAKATLCPWTWIWFFETSSSLEGHQTGFFLKTAMFLSYSNSSLHFSHGLQANSSCYRYANYLEEFCLRHGYFVKTAPGRKLPLLKRWGSMYKRETIYHRFTGASRPDSDQQGSTDRLETKRFRDFVLSLGFLLVPSCLQYLPTSCPVPPPFPWHKRCLNLGHT